VTWVLLPYVLVAAMFTLLQRKLIYLPLRESVSALETGLPAEQIRDVQVTTEDGLTLRGWLILADGALPAPTAHREALASDERPLIIYFAGNGGHRAYRLPEIDQFINLGCHVLYFDYRGYADNPGSPTEADFARDARTVWQYATGELAVPPARIVLWGESLGGAVATRLAAEVCEAGDVPRGLMLRSTFTSLVEAGGWHYPWLPVRWVLIDRYPSIERIPRITCPLLVIHGRQDQIVPFEMGERLYAAAPAQSRNGVAKTFLELPEAGHNDVMYVAAGEVERALSAFLERL
jgi:fermentation-respiration switch protein FrsA (DUF1100 family)